MLPCIMQATFSHFCSLGPYTHMARAPMVYGQIPSRHGFRSNVEIYCITHTYQLHVLESYIKLSNNHCTCWENKCILQCTVFMLLVTKINYIVEITI